MFKNRDIDYILCYYIKVNKYKRNEIIYSVYFDYKGRELEFNYRK